MTWRSCSIIERSARSRQAEEQDMGRAAPGAFFFLALLIGCREAPSQQGDPIPVLIVSGANNHDWEWTTPSLKGILEESGKFSVDVTYEPAKTLADDGALRKYTAFVLDYNNRKRAWGDAGERNFLNAVRSGTGVVIVHAANNAFPGWVEYEKLVGHLWRQGTGHGRFHRFSVTMNDKTHPITRGLRDFKQHPDELYHCLVHMHDAQHEILATALSSKESGGTGEHEPMITVGSYGEGRVFHTPLGHVWKGQPQTRASHLDPQFRNLIVRGTEWAATGDVRETTRHGANELSADEKKAGFKLLFDGKTTQGWRGFRKPGFPEKGWVVEDGAIRKVKGAGGGDIMPIEQYRDFDLRFEWKVAQGANSGIMIRSSEKFGSSWRTGPEYQILDDLKHRDGRRAETSAGALYALKAAEGKVLKPVGEWNTGRIVLLGTHLEHWVNGKKVVEIELQGEEWTGLVAASKFRTMEGFGAEPYGYIVFQDHGDDVWFRNLRIKRLAEVPKDLPEVALFNGKDLTGFAGFHRGGAQTQDVWSVKNGILVCEGRPPGYLHTEKKYEDFVLRVVWRWSPETKRGGNSGVLIRMIGDHKVWPKSIEAQLAAGRAGDIWNIDKFVMDVATNRTRGRRTVHTHANENALGQWNEYEIFAHGGRVVLKVNGQVLNEIENAEKVPGHICFQSEGTPIHFKEIAIRDLSSSK